MNIGQIKVQRLRNDDRPGKLLNLLLQSNYLSNNTININSQSYNTNLTNKKFMELI